MSLPCIIEVTVGVVDGINRIFEVSTDYKTDSVVVFLNGVSKVQQFSDGWVEMGMRRIRLNRPPKSGDVVFAYFIPL